MLSKDVVVDNDAYKQLKALADSWDAAVHGLPLGGVVAWEGMDGQTIRWGEGETKDSSAASPPTAFLMPPAAVGERHRVLYTASHHTVSFFEKSGTFLRYKLLDQVSLTTDVSSFSIY